MVSLRESDRQAYLSATLAILELSLRDNDMVL